MALSEAERKAMEDYQALLRELEDERPSFLDKGAPKIPEPETRPIANTGPDLAGQLRREADAIKNSTLPAGAPDADLTGTPGSMVSQYGIDEKGKLGSNWIGTPHDEAKGFAEFSAGMLAPQVIGPLANRVATGAVARSAAREPGALREALKDIPRAATSNVPAQAALDIAASTVGVPHGTVTALKTLPSVARAGGMMVDEGLAAAGRAAGIKPWSPVTYANPVPGVALHGGYKPSPELASKLALRASGEIAPGLPHPVPIDTGGVPVPIAPETTVPIPRQSMAELDPLKGRVGGVDLAADAARKAALPDDFALLDKTQKIDMRSAVPPTSNYERAMSEYTALADKARAKQLKADALPAAIRGKQQAAADRIGRFAEIAKADVDLAKNGRPATPPDSLESKLRDSVNQGFSKNTDVGRAGPRGPVEPQPSREAPAFTKTEEFRAKMAANEEAKFAKNLGMSVEDYRAMMERRNARIGNVKQAIQNYTPGADSAALRKDLADSIFED